MRRVRKSKAMLTPFDSFDYGEAGGQGNDIMDGGDQMAGKSWVSTNDEIYRRAA